MASRDGRAWAEREEGGGRWMVANGYWTDGSYVVANSILTAVWMEGIRVIMWI